jgi:RNA polymerase sigma-70 factor (ECF subfamily)
LSLEHSTANQAELFTHLFRRYGARIYQYFKKHVKGHEIAEDLLQELFANIWSHRDNLRHEKNIEAYLFVSARNHLFNNLKKVLNEATADLSEADLVITNEPVAAALQFKETQATYHKALEMLSEQRRRAFTLSREQGLSYRQIATEMGISPRTVEKHISEALQLLRQTMPTSCLLSLLFTIW